MGMTLSVAEFIFFWANWVLVGALAAGVVATYLVVVSGNVKETAAKKESIEAGRLVAEAGAIAATANKEAADARERAAKIEQQIAPRTLSVGTIEKLILVLPAYPGRTIRVMSYALDVESAVLATQFLGTLNGTSITPIDARLAYSALGSLAFGVRVYGTDAELVASLKSAIARSNLDLLDEPPPSPTMTAGNVMSPVSATVFVAAKPPPK